MITLTITYKTGVSNGAGYGSDERERAIFDARRYFDIGMVDHVEVTDSNDNTLFYKDHEYEEEKARTHEAEGQRLLEREDDR